MNKDQGLALLFMALFLVSLAGNVIQFKARYELDYSESGIHAYDKPYFEGRSDGAELATEGMLLELIEVGQDSMKESYSHVLKELGY